MSSSARVCKLLYNILKYRLGEVAHATEGWKVLPFLVFLHFLIVLASSRIQTDINCDAGFSWSSVALVVAKPTPNLLQFNLGSAQFVSQLSHTDMKMVLYVVYFLWFWIIYVFLIRRKICIFFIFRHFFLDIEAQIFKHPVGQMYKHTDEQIPLVSIVIYAFWNFKNYQNHPKQIIRLVLHLICCTCK